MSANPIEPNRPDIPIVDAHVHVHAAGLGERIVENMDDSGCRRINFVSLIQPDGNQNAILRHYQEKHPDRFYLFGALDYGLGAGDDPRNADPVALAERLAGQPAQLKAEGFDGIKLIESKPTARRRLPWPLDSDVYAGFFAGAEKAGLPITWHVGDPRDFWDPQRIHEWARSRGWLYDPAADASLEQLRAEAAHVIDRQPGLTVIFAHFFFLGDQLDRARDLLQRRPNVYLDTTPGGQMYAFFNVQREAARDFFIEFQDRLIFGTDISFGRKEAAWPGERASRPYRLFRAYFGSDETMPPEFPGMHLSVDGRPFRGLDLPEAVQHKVFHANFERLAGAAAATLPAA